MHAFVADCYRLLFVEALVVLLEERSQHLCSGAPQSTAKLGSGNHILAEPLYAGPVELVPLRVPAVIKRGINVAVGLARRASLQ